MRRQKEAIHEHIEKRLVEKDEEIMAKVREIESEIM